jgi:hypothetical protein
MRKCSAILQHSVVLDVACTYYTVTCCWTMHIGCYYVHAVYALVMSVLVSKVQLTQWYLKPAWLAALQCNISIIYLQVLREYQHVLL